MSAETLSKLAHQQQLELESPVRGPAYPFLFGNDVDSVDVATRVAMVKFFHSPNLFGDFSRDTRTLRLYPRPIVTIQLQSLLNSRQKLSPFMTALVGTQSVECFAEWSLAPTNVAFRHIINGLYDPIQIGDKPRWFIHHLQAVCYCVCQENDRILRLLEVSNGDGDDLSISDESQESSSISFNSDQDEGEEGAIEDAMSAEDGGEKEMSFPSDVSVAGSDAAVETGSEKSAFAPSPLSSTGNTNHGIKPPTPTVTPRCSSPISNLLPTKPNQAGEFAKDQISTDELSAQELFFNIEQLTQQAKESFDLSRVQSIKSAVVNREKLSSVGKSVVGNLAASKKLEFFKALAGSTPPLTPSTSSVTKKSNPSNNSQEEHVNKEESETRPPPARPVSPKYDISFPKSNLCEIALPRPSSRLPKKELMRNETPETPSPPPPSHPPPPPPPLVHASLPTIQTTEPPPSSTVSLPYQSDFQSTLEHHQPIQEPATPTPEEPYVIPPSPKISSTRTIETTTSRFLAEHHPQLTRSNSTLSNVSSYSQTTQDIFSSISSDLSGFATQTSSLLESMFGYTSGASYNSRNQGPRYAPAVSGDNTNMIKDAVDRILMGEGVGWLKLNRLKKLMEEEMHRSLLLNYLQRKFGQHLTRDGHIEDLCLSKSVWKGVLRLLTAVIHGLETTFSYGYNSSSTQTGLASAFQLLELIHTHYWSPAETMGISNASSPIVTDTNGSTQRRLLNRLHPDLERVGSNESAGSSTLQDNAFETESETGSLTEAGCMMATSGVFRNSMHDGGRSAMVVSRRSVMSEGEIDHMASASLYEELIKHLPKKSVLSGLYRFRCGSLEPVTTDENQWAEKSYLFEGLIPLTFLQPKPVANGNSSTEHRSSAVGSVGINHPTFLWQDMQFWEDLFCDTVAQERHLIGMDSGAEELLERYKALAENEKRVLENDEDRLLSVILYNLTAFMLLMQVLAA